MKSEVVYGLFGKLPMHGDFVHRNLSSSFISCWDEWMQHYIAGSKEQIGENWLDIYLTSPLWRFVLTPGVVDENHWAGILMPSVDQVGRYYPFSVVLPLPGNLNPLEFISMQGKWYENIEELSLQALDGEYDVDDLLGELNTIETSFESGYNCTGRLMESDALQVNMEFEEQLPSSVYAHFLDSILKRTFNSYSMWSTQGSEMIEPCVFSVQGLPSVSKIPAMLDGQWEYWGWQQTYDLNRTTGLVMEPEYSSEC